MDTIRRRPFPHLQEPSSSLHSLSKTFHDSPVSHNSIHQEKSRKEMDLRKKQWRSFRQWLMGEKDLPVKERLYCGSRFSLITFLILNFLLIGSIITIIVLSVLYFAVVPNIIRNAFNGLNGPNAAGLDLVRVLNMSDTTAEVSFDGVIRGGLTSIPTVVRGPLNISFYYGNSAFASLVVDQGIVLNQPTTGSPGRFVIVNQETAKKAISCNNPPSICDSFSMQSDMDVEILGTLWYRNFHVTSFMSLPEKAPASSDPSKTNANGNSSGISVAPTNISAISNKVTEAIPPLIRAPVINDEIRKLPGADNLLYLGPGLPLIKLDSAKVDSITPSQATVTLEVKLENPTVLDVSVKQIKVGFGMRRDLRMTVQIDSDAQDGSPLSLKKGLNSFRVRVSISYDVNSLGSLSVSNNSIYGPLNIISLQEKDFIGAITSDLTIPVKADLATAIATFALKNILSIKDPFAALDPKNPNSPFNINNPLNPFRPGSPLADLSGLLTNNARNALPIPGPADLLGSMKLLASLANEASRPQ